MSGEKYCWTMAAVISVWVWKCREITADKLNLSREKAEYGILPAWNNFWASDMTFLAKKEEKGHFYFIFFARSHHLKHRRSI